MTVYFSLGANLGDRKQNLQNARRQIEERIGNLTAISSEYETEPWGFNSENMFLNQVVAAETNLSPQKILDITKEIEKNIGRTEKTQHAYKDRLIDIDLLLADNTIIKTKNLTLPHPTLHKRLFVLEPLCEIAPALVHPVLGKSLKDFIKDLEKKS